MRLILLLDMDYFYAACEELRNPGLKDKPVVVGADPKNGTGRGVVSTCNYIARKYGIKSGMPISTAYKLKKDAVYLQLDEKYYEETSAKIMSELKNFTTKLEQVSIDEAFLDISNTASSYEEALAYAQKIKNDIVSKFSLPCSIGISTNKLIAKMACEAAKPNGIKLVKEEEAKAFLSAMPVGKLYGVGVKSTEKLKEMGFNTIGDLANADKQVLVNAFGSFGIEIYMHANAIDNEEVIESYEIKSISREHTFEFDTDSRKEIEEMISVLASEVISEVRKQGFLFKTITLKIRYANFDEHLHSRGVGHYTGEEAKAREIALDLFNKNAINGEKIRKLGLRVSGLIKSIGQKSLLDYIN